MTSPRNLISAGLLGGLMVLSGGALAQEHVLKFSVPAPPAEDAANTMFKRFAELVETGSGGKIDVQFFYGGQLGSIPSVIEGVAMGTVEMSIQLTGFLAALDPRYSVLDAPGLFKDEAHANRVFRDPEVRSMIAGFGTGTNTEVLMLFTAGELALASKNPIQGTADFNGKKVRTGGATPLVNLPLEKLGASPVSFSLGEVLPAIQTGVLDAGVANLPTFIGFKFADVAPNVTYLPGSVTAASALISRDFLDKIGPDLEAVVRKSAVEAFPPYDQMLAADKQRFEGIWKKFGGTINQFIEGEQQAYLKVVSQATEEILSANERLAQDYQVLRDAAERLK